MFEVKQVTKSFNGVPALQDVTFPIDKGECVSILGPSGAGKTTLLHLMGGLLHPDEGEIRVDGTSTTELEAGEERAKQVGVMHQEFDLVESLTVLNNVLAGRLGSWGFWRSFVSLLIPRERTKALDALRRVGIPDKIDQRTSELSGGEKQRVAMARLLMQRPRAVLVDEPVASVDPARADDLLDMLIRIARDNGLTLVVSLHSVDLALKFFPRIIALRQGRVFFDRPSASIERDHLADLYELRGITAPH